MISFVRSSTTWFCESPGPKWTRHKKQTEALTCHGEASTHPSLSRVSWTSFPARSTLFTQSFQTPFLTDSYFYINLSSSCQRSEGVHLNIPFPTSRESDAPVEGWRPSSKETQQTLSVCAGFHEAGDRFMSLQAGTAGPARFSLRKVFKKCIYVFKCV